MRSALGAVRLAWTMPRRLQSLTWTPEFNVALFAFLLNLPWELWQVPLFEHMPLK